MGAFLKLPLQLQTCFVKRMTRSTSQEKRNQVVGMPTQDYRRHHFETNMLLNLLGINTISKTVNQHRSSENELEKLHSARHV